MSPSTPQQNSVIEWGFATLYYRISTIQANIRLDENLKTVLWTECRATATKLENMMVNPQEKNAHMRSSMKKLQTT